jgi:hypothetical protein
VLSERRKRVVRHQLMAVQLRSSGVKDALSKETRSGRFRLGLLIPALFASGMT